MLQPFKAKFSAVANVFSAALVGGFIVLSGATMNAAVAKAESRPTSLPDGVYLYGQSQKPDELGKAYFVFESKKGQVIGALYMPSSSFDCATGSFKEKQLALQVMNSYDRTTNAFNIALERTATVAFSTANSPIREIGLEGFYKLDTVSDNDRRILNVCKTDLLK
jgi:hypothetical protein